MRNYLLYINVDATTGVVERGSIAERLVMSRKRRLDLLSELTPEEIQAEKAARGALLDNLVKLYMHEGIDAVARFIPDARIRCEVVDLFIQKMLHYDVDVNAANFKGHTFLMLAGAFGSNHSVISLLQKGANVNICCHHQEMTPLMYAAKYGKTNNVKKLLFAGSYVEQRVRENSGPLSGAKASDIAKWFKREEARSVITDLEEALAESRGSRYI